MKDNNQNFEEQNNALKEWEERLKSIAALLNQIKTTSGEIKNNFKDIEELSSKIAISKSNEGSGKNRWALSLEALTGVGSVILAAIGVASVIVAVAIILSG